jgi:uncharacterized membrane-anchored protein
VRIVGPLVRFGPIAVAMLMLAGPSSAATDPGLEQRQQSELHAMHWNGGLHSLDASHGRFLVPSGANMVQSSEAQRFDEIINGTTSSDSEGVVIFKGRTLYLSYDDSGFVTVDDWKDIDATKLLSGMRDSTERSNDERAKNGVSPIHVDGWVQPPTLDRRRKSVRWVTGLHDEQQKHFVNAVALQLGRHGFERFTLVSRGDDPAGDRALLASLVNDYRFDSGARFQDYVKGDKLAGYGIAALVGTAAGATLLKTGAFAAVLLLLKKFIIVIIALGVGLFGWLRKTLAGGRMQVGPPRSNAPKA